MEKKKTGLRSKQIALISTLSAVYALLRYIPTIPMLGVAGGSFSLSDTVAPIYGILLGPFLGAASVTLGTFIAIALGRPIIFLGLDFLPAAVNAFTIGLILKGKRSYSILILGGVLAAFLFHPLTLRFVKISGFAGELLLPFNWLHFLAFALLASPLAGSASKWVTESALRKSTFAIFTLVFIGTMTQHVTGGLLTEIVAWVYLGRVPRQGIEAVWTAIFFLYPFERLALTVIATIIGTPLLRSLRAYRIT